MIITVAQEFWTVLNRYHRNRSNPMMPGAAVRHMRKLEVTSPALQRRVNAFVNRHRIGSPSDGGGPRRA